MTDQEMIDRLGELAETAKHNGEVHSADEADFVDPADEQMFTDLAARLRPDATLAEFTRLYALSEATYDTKYRGYPLPWCPLDLWMLQELIFAGKPFWAVETDTLYGGMAIYLGDLLDQVQRGRVLSTGMRRPPSLPEHRRVRWLDRDPRIAASEARRRIWEEHEPVPSLIVVHGVLDPEEYDSLLRLYGDLAVPGSYLVAYGTWIPEIAEVVRKFVAESPFRVDPDCERHGLTLAPNGWLHLPPVDLPSAP